MRLFFFKRIALIFLSYLFGAFCLIACAMAIKNEISTESIETKTETKVTVNNSNRDSVLVYLRLGVADSSWTDDVNGIFNIKSSTKTQGSFWLKSNESVSYNSNKPIQGNISFWNEPNNCPYPDSAITLYEFTLNNQSTVINAQETVDISCVAGVSTIGSITMKNGGAWTDNFTKKAILNIQNKPLYQNSNVSGVFPYGCTNCINQKGAPDCEGRPKYAKPSSKNICNVQRNAKDSGGEVTITYINKN